MKCETCNSDVCVRTPCGSAIKVGRQNGCVVLDLDKDKVCQDGPCGPTVQSICRTFVPDNYPGPITYFNYCACPKLVSVVADGKANQDGSSLDASLYIDGQTMGLGTYVASIVDADRTAHFRADVVVYPDQTLTFEPYITGSFDKVRYSVVSY